MAFSDYYSGSALSGALTGAVPGFMTGNPYLAIGGGALGLYAGAQANQKHNEGTEAQKASLAQAAASMRALSQQTYTNYLAGLKKAQQFYNPAIERYNYLYATGTGQGDFPKVK